MEKLAKKMVGMVFIHPDGRRERHEAPAGDTVMDCALDNEVDGIGGQCGGACNCSTCHCYVVPGWLDRLPGMSADEEELLGYVPTRRPGSRLGCQITLAAALDGLEVEIPP